MVEPAGAVAPFVTLQQPVMCHVHALATQPRPGMVPMLR